MACYEFKLPWPPTSNNLFPTVRPGKRMLSRKGKAYAKHVGDLVLIGHVPRVTLGGCLGLRLIARPPDRHARDLDNLFKAPLDALKKAGMIRDDADFEQLSIIRGEVVAGGRLEVCIWEIEDQAWPHAGTVPVANDQRPAGR